MDPALVQAGAVSVVQLFAPFLKKAAQAGADVAWQKAKQLYEFVSQKLGSNPHAVKAIEELRAKPEEVKAQEVVQQQVKLAMFEDQAFANRLLDMLEDVKKADDRQMFGNQFHGSVGNVVQLRDITGGVVNIGTHGGGDGVGGR